MIPEVGELELSLEITGKDSRDDRKQKVVHQLKRATRVVCVPSVNHISISVEREWFTRYVESMLGFIYDSHIAQVT